MKQVKVTWEPDAGRFVAAGGHRGYPIAINAPHEGGGVTGFSAAELLLAGAGSCSAWDVVSILRKQRQEIEAIEVAVTGEQDPEPPWPYRRIELVYRVRGRDLSRRAVERAVRLSVDRYCAVLATVRGVASVECRIEMDGEPPRAVAVRPPAEAGTR